MSQGLCFPAWISLPWALLLALREWEICSTSKPLCHSRLCDPSQSAAPIHHSKRDVCVCVCNDRLERPGAESQMLSPEIKWVKGFKMQEEPVKEAPLQSVAVTALALGPSISTSIDCHPLCAEGRQKDTTQTSQSFHVSKSLMGAENCRSQHPPWVTANASPNKHPSDADKKLLSVNTLFIALSH